MRMFGTAVGWGLAAALISVCILLSDLMPTNTRPREPVPVYLVVIP